MQGIPDLFLRVTDRSTMMPYEGLPVAGEVNPEIEQLAQDLHRLKTAPLHYTGLEYTNSGVQNMRALLILFGLSGNLDRPGGLVFRMPRRAYLRRNRIDPPQGKIPIGHDRHPLFCDLNHCGQFMEIPSEKSDVPLITPQQMLLER